MAFILVQFASVMVFGWGDRRIMKVENMQKYEGSFFSKAINFLWQSGESGYQHVWPVSFFIVSFLVFELSSLCFSVSYTHLTLPTKRIV